MPLSSPQMEGWIKLRRRSPGHRLGTVDLGTEAVITWDTSAVTGCDFGLYLVRADVNSHQD